MSNILITGGAGHLAAELKKHLAGDYVGRKDLDFTQPIHKGDYELIVHMGTYTDVKKAEREPYLCFQTNTYGTFNLVHTYRDTPFVYVSTEYAHNPIGVYALTKKFAEEIVKTHPHHLIVRTLFKPNPWPFPKAYRDQYTQGDYVDVIAKLLAEKIMSWDRNTSEFAFVGTGRKTMFELAKRTRPNVEPNSVDEFMQATGVPIPKDYE